MCFGKKQQLLYLFVGRYLFKYLFSLQEFACREVHESSGDWILYFATNAELERFISALEMLWDYQNDEVILQVFSSSFLAVA